MKDGSRLGLMSEVSKQKGRTGSTTRVREKPKGPMTRGKMLHQTDGRSDCQRETKTDGGGG